MFVGNTALLTVTGSHSATTNTSIRGVLHSVSFHRIDAAELSNSAAPIPSNTNTAIPSSLRPTNLFYFEYGGVEGALSAIESSYVND